MNDNLIVIGSFLWNSKKDNLLSFLNACKKHNFEKKVIVAGKMTDSLCALITKKYPFVDVVRDFCSLDDLKGLAGIGICPDFVGGGFKLKVFDYYKLGLPILSVRGGSSGVPEEIIPQYSDYDVLIREANKFILSQCELANLREKQFDYFRNRHAFDFFAKKIVQNLNRVIEY